MITLAPRQLAKRAAPPADGAPTPKKRDYRTSKKYVDDKGQNWEFSEETRRWRKEGSTGSAKKLKPKTEGDAPALKPKSKAKQVVPPDGDGQKLQPKATNKPAKSTPKPKPSAPAAQPKPKAQPAPVNEVPKFGTSPKVDKVAEKSEQLKTQLRSLHQKSKELIHNSKHHAIHEADSLGENIVSWKVGKVIGSAVAQFAIAHGAPPGATEIIGETVVQAATAAAIKAIKLKNETGKIDPREVASHFVKQAAAAYVGKHAHQGMDWSVESLGMQGMAEDLLPLIAGKVSGLSTAVGMGRSGMDKRVVDAVVRRSQHDINLLGNALNKLTRGALQMSPVLVRKSADGGLDERTSALLWDLTQAGILLGMSHDQGTRKTLTKSADPIKRVMRWWKLPIGISHDAGDKRHGRTIPVGYGHIRGSYGDAEDGMSVDVYIGPDLGSQNVFRVKQVKPETKEIDEYKYFIGCWTQDEVKQFFLRCMPKRFFDGVEDVALKSLAKYQVG